MEHQLQSAISLFAEFFDAIKQAVAIVDEQGNYVYYNEECARMDDTKVERVIGKPMLNVYPQMDENSSTLLQSLHHNTRYHHQYQIYFNTLGRAVHNLHTTLPLIAPDGKTVGAIEVGNNLAVISHLLHTLGPEHVTEGLEPPDSKVVFSFEAAAMTDGRLAK